MTLNVEHLSFDYGQRSILSNISFRLNAGDVVAVLGPNGSGKSTLFRCLNRILHPKSGLVQLSDRNIAELSAEQRAQKITYVPQRTEATSFSVFDAVLLGRKPYFTWFASQKDYKAVEDILDRLGLESLASRPIDRLSGGELQRVALARAFVQESDLLILDEPASALDLKNQVDIFLMLCEIAQERKIMVLISVHDINIAIRYADRFLFLQNGQLVGDVRREGLTSKLIERVYGLPVDIHTSNQGISFIVER